MSVNGDPLVDSYGEWTDDRRQQPPPATQQSQRMSQGGVRPAGTPLSTGLGVLRSGTRYQPTPSAPRPPASVASRTSRLSTSTTARRQSQIELERDKKVAELKKMQREREQQRERLQEEREREREKEEFEELMKIAEKEAEVELLKQKEEEELSHSLDGGQEPPVIPGGDRGGKEPSRTEEWAEEAKKYEGRCPSPESNPVEDVGRRSIGSQERPVSESQDMTRDLLEIIKTNQAILKSHIEGGGTAGGHHGGKPPDLPIFDGNPREWPLFISTFNMTTETHRVSQADNTYRLQKCLKGKAKEKVESLLVVAGNVDAVIRTLERNYGRPELIVKSLVQKVKNFPACKDDRPEMMSDLADVVNSLVTTMENVKCETYMCSPELIEEIIRKIPPGYRPSWCDAFKAVGTPSLREISQWLLDRAQNAVFFSELFTGSVHKNQKEVDQGRRGNRTSRVAVASTDEKPEVKKRSDHCFHCNSPGHVMQKCEAFKKLSTQEKWTQVRAKHICYRCFVKGHNSTECKLSPCGVNGCKKSHHQSLHYEPAPPQQLKVMLQQSCASEDVVMGVLPVTVTGPGGDYSTYALLDSGAESTFIDASVSEKIGVTGPRTSIRVTGFSAKKSGDHAAQRVKFRIRGPSGVSHYVKNVVSMRNIELPVYTVNVEKLKRRYGFLDGVGLSAVQEVKPTILIGVDQMELLRARREVHGEEGGPTASETKLGWVVQGPITPTPKHSTTAVLLASIQQSDSLHQLVKESFQTETFGVKLVEEPKRSVEDTRAVQIMEESTCQKRKVTESTDVWMESQEDGRTAAHQTGRWETGLPWKSDSVELPESKSVALRRLKGIEKKMDADAKFGEEYCEKIQAYVDKGFARKLSEQEARQEGPRTWYLPHFDVHNPNKPGKWRLVFDAAAKCGGVSLNDVLIQGPDLLTPLPKVLFKFRQKKIGFTGDIKDFFHRILIRPEDAGAQRFLWRGMNRSRPPDVMQMQVMVFGAVSSPFCAQYVRNKNAQRFIQDYPEAVKGVVSKHYIDDYLDCADTVEDALKLIKDVVTIHRKGGFQIVGWTCSSREVLDQLPDDLKSAGQKDLEPESDLPMARVLGLHWDPNEDAFTFTCKFNKVNDEIVSGRKIPTKREMLKLVMSVFDPLGFLSHFTIKAKILLQEVWRSKVGWDDEVSPALFGKWCKWLDELQGIQEMKIPRCYSVRAKEAHSIQLHVFCDASDKAFSAVAYFRVDSGLVVDVSFVMGRTRVAPLKTISIPRLELQAAVMASRLSVTIMESNDLKVDECHFWTDNRAVLCWLRSESRNFKPFVSHRIGEIQDVTEVSNWHWVPTAMNLADDATRDVEPSDFGPCSRWVNGPEFLKLSQEEWPKERKKLDEYEFDDEVLEKKVSCLVVKTAVGDSLPDVSRFSSFQKLIRSTAWVMRFVRACGKGAPTNSPSWEQWRAPVIQCQGGGGELRRSQKSSPAQSGIKELRPCELFEAECFWWRKVQWDSFPDEMALLRDGKEIPDSSRLHKLSPDIMDGIMRLKGRTDLGSLPQATKHPVILDPRHPFTRLLVQYYHVRARHQGQGMVVNELRQKYWILNLRVAVKSIWNSCLICRIRRAKPSQPEMGQLPEFRLERASRPFVTTGLDYFGPMEVTIGRRHEKRYGALFTCLTTRAVHLEIAASLNTDSAIMAVRRFIARRGCPAKMYSDNGTNFVGAAAEMKKALLEIDWTKVEEEFSGEGMEWSFIPPSAPHMGGTWERLVRSVKTALRVTLKERAPREEVLQTLFAEAENVVNSRPLTHVSLDPDDEESLTPNHFLIGSSNGVAAPGRFTDTDLCLRKQWRFAQRLADRFWTRWVNEYLPTLTKRTKWFKKSEPIKVGDLVLIADGDLPRNSWPRGRVTQVFPGKDGQVRVAEVMTQKGSLRRPVVKLCILDITPILDKNPKVTVK